MRCTISGNYLLPELQLAYDTFSRAGIEVLSPPMSGLVTSTVSLDRMLDQGLRDVKDRHFMAISQSDFLYVIAPNTSGIMPLVDMGFALAHEVPVYASDPIYDNSIREYVQRVGTPDEIVYMLKQR